MNNQGQVRSGQVHEYKGMVRASHEYASSSELSQVMPRSGECRETPGQEVIIQGQVSSSKVRSGQVIKNKVR